MKNEPTVIVGTGLAGYTLAREFRSFDADAPLIMVTADAGDFYSKPMLSTALARDQAPADLVMTPADEMRQRLRLGLHTRTPVTGLDPRAHRLETVDGPIAYGRLVLAVGATPIRPPLRGEAAADVLSVNNLADYARFRERLTPQVRSVALIGPGLIGCEFANDLTVTGRTVDVVGPDPHPLSTLLPARAGRDLQTGLGGAGVRWHLETIVERVERQAQGYRLVLANGERLEADLVVAAVGLRPDIALAQGAGLATGRGILVDRRLRSSDPCVYAIGDCAEVDGLVLPYVMPIQHAAKALAQTLTGTPTEVRYPAMPVVVKTTLHPVAVAPPPRGADGQWVEETLEGGVRARYLSPDGQLLGFALTGTAAAERQTLARSLPPTLG